MNSENQVFTIRSGSAKSNIQNLEKPLPPPETVPGLSYTPGKSSALSEHDRKTWSIKEDDFFSIYFTTAADLLDHFESNLIATGSDKNTALQHRNQVNLIWKTVDQGMQLFPVNLLSNIHLFRDFYHQPNFAAIGTKDGVQAGTLRARYVSLGIFLQYLRKFQIFAGMNRRQIKMLEETVQDFNKDLNHHIKQRKVEVRQHKRNNLLTASHFINFGKSKFVQNLIQTANDLSVCKFTSGFAIDFRNYLIASLVIGNGLRSSNIIELGLNDFKHYTTAEDYPGHKIVVNDCYKTSTIYGEKFIVVPDQLFDHYIFYAEKLRHLIYDGKSHRAFVPNGGRPYMNQSNVASALTSAFTKAKVLSEHEYERVSCTRIRCGLATFACNEVGFETAFVANHFMKNKEETTALHYNLLANQRHALNIAMKLYDSFK